MKNTMKKKPFFIFLLLLLVLTGCGGNNVFSFDGEKVTKLDINDVEITDIELIIEISNMFDGIDGNKDKTLRSNENYRYFLMTHGLEDNNFFSISDTGELYKAGTSNDPDIFGLNFCYIGYMESDNLNRFVEIYNEAFVNMQY